LSPSLGRVRIIRLTKLEKLADISERVSATSSKKEKVSLIAGLLKQAKDKEIALAAHYLSGQLPQGRLRVAWKMLQGATQGLSSSPRCLTLTDLDAFFQGIATEAGRR
jgi:DNA ligase-1